MRKITTIALLSALSINAWAGEPVPDSKALHRELVKYLQKQGQLCLGKSDWPIDVSQQDFQENARDAVQMPVLEKLGLVTSTVAETQRLGVDDNALHTVAVKRYELTRAGRQSYVDKDNFARGSGAAREHHKDLCAAKLTLDKIVRWEPADVGQGTVFYTYHVTAVPWVKSADALKVFPMIDKIIKGEGTLQLSQRMRLGREGWTAVPGV
jgi:hypothetical protein